MRVQLLPTTVSPGPARRCQYLTTLLTGDDLAIDAGGLGLLGDLDRQANVRHVFLTHTHMDHIASLPIFLENVFLARDECVTLHLTSEALDCLRRDIVNDRVWPYFIRLSEQGQPFVKVEELVPGRSVEVAGRRLTPIGVDHVVPTVGFLIESAGRTIAVPWDTGPSEDFWRAAAKATQLRAVFLDACFPNKIDGLARVSKYLTPRCSPSRCPSGASTCPSSRSTLSRGLRTARSRGCSRWAGTFRSASRGGSTSSEG